MSNTPTKGTKKILVCGQCLNPELEKAIFCHSLNFGKRDFLGGKSLIYLNFENTEINCVNHQCHTCAFFLFFLYKLYMVYTWYLDDLHYILMIFSMITGHRRAEVNIWLKKWDFEKNQRGKIPHTGDKASLDRCG